MSRAGSHKAKRARAEEDKVVGKIDHHRELKEIYEQLTDDEKTAFEISLGAAMPDEKHTRAWAAKVMRSVTETKCLGLCAKCVLFAKEIDLGVLKIMEYAVPKPKQTIEQSGPDGGPISVSMTKLAEIPPEPKDYQDWLKMREFVREDANRSIDEKIKELETKLKPTDGDALELDREENNDAQT